MKNPVKWLLALLLVLTGVYFYRFDPVGVDTAKFYFQLTAVSILIVVLGALVFLVIVLFSSRVWGKLKKVPPKTSEGGVVKERVKGVWDVVGVRVVGFVLWVFVLVSFRALFPEAFAAWWGHQNIFWISQLVAVLLIFFLPAKYSAPLFGLVIAVMLWSAVDSTFWPEKKEKPKEVARVSTTGKFCWHETEKGTGWRKDVKNEKGCFSAKILEHDKTHLLMKYKTKDGYGTCDWDKLKDPQYGEWKEVGRNNGGNCMLIQTSRDLFTGWFESHYDTKGRHIPGYRDKYYVELRLN